MNHLFLTRADLNTLLKRLDDQEPSRIVKLNKEKCVVETVYLSRRNITTLLAKLNRFGTHGDTSCTIIKRDMVHPLYPCTTPTVLTALETGESFDEVGYEVIALEDEEYYTDREPGPIRRWA